MPVTLDEFLVGLGFRVDNAQQNRFVDAIKASRTGVTSLNAEIQEATNKFANLATVGLGAALSIAGAITKISSNMAALGFQSQIVGASEKNLKAYAYAFEQVGGSAEEAAASITAASEHIRAHPGIERALTQIGVTSTDRAEQLQQFGAWARHMRDTLGPIGVAQAQRAGQGLLGQSPLQTQRLMNQDFDRYYAEQQRMAAAAGLDYKKAADAGIALTRQVQQLQEQFSILSIRVQSTYAPIIKDALIGINGWLEAHSGQIGHYFDLTKQNLDGATSALQKWFNALPGEAKSALGIGGAAIGARAAGGVLSQLARVVGLGSLAGPIGALGSLAIGFTVLASDYEIWEKTGGKDSLIDWNKWKPEVEAALDAFEKIKLGFTTITAAGTQILGFIGPLVEGTDKWKTGLDLVADVIIYKITGPLGLAVKLIGDLTAWYQKAEKEHPFPLEQGKTGPLTDEEKGKLQQENNAINSKLDNWFFRLFPSLKQGPLLPGASLDSQYVPRDIWGNAIQKQSYEQEAPGPGNIHAIAFNAGRSIHQGFQGMMGGALSQPGPEHAQAEGVLSSLEQREGLPAGVLDRIWAQESGRGRNMVSSAGAMGHFQFMAGTARRFGVQNPFDFGQSAEGAARYMHSLMGRFQGDIAKALAGYNWGEGNVERVVRQFGEGWREHLPQETSNYIARIMNDKMGPQMPRGYNRGMMAGAGGEDGGARLHQVSFGDTSIQVHGVSDPQQAARLVDQSQRKHGSEMVRRLQGIWA